MCGIVAIYSKGGVDPVALETASKPIAHRGPDASGIMLSESKICGLASRRLALNDLEGGNQPLTTAAGRVIAVINGEFYDFNRIREELIARGHNFSTKSDSEILLPLYIEHGLNCLKYLRGEFAFALWDESKGTLFAARDRFGIKPLYYSWIGDQLVLASEIKALIGAGLKLRWHRENLIDQLILIQGQSQSLFRGVYQVPPGHLLRVTNGKMVIERYWDIDFPSLGEKRSDRTLDEVIENLRSEIDTAVHLRMESDVPIGCFLSGGIDSAAVLGIANAGSRKTQAFTVGFSENDYNESAHAQETAALNSVPHNIIPVTFESIADAWPDTVWHAETIGDNARGVARFLQCKAVRRAGLKAVLSGEGADEIFGGYFFSRLDYMRSTSSSSNGGSFHDPYDTPAIFQSSISQQAIKPVSFLEDTIGFTPSWIYGALTHRAGIMRKFLHHDLKLISQNDGVLERVLHDGDVLSRVRNRHPVHQSLYIWIKTMLLNMILVADRLEMAAPVESRIPFLDHRLAETAQNIPVSFLFATGIEKYPLRQAVKDRVTESTYSRSKQPFTAPHALRASKNRLRDFIGDLINSAELRESPFFDHSVVKRTFDGIDSGDQQLLIPIDQAMMLVMHTCLMQRVFRPSF